MARGVLFQREQFLLRPEAGGAVVLHGQPRLPFQPRRPCILDRQRHRVGERIAQGGDVDPLPHARVAESFLVGLKGEAVQDAVAHRDRDVTHANDVAVAPFVDRIDAAAQAASEARPVFPPRILPDLAEIVPLGSDAAGYAIAQRAQADLDRDQAERDAAGQREPSEPHDAIGRRPRFVRPRPALPPQSQRSGEEQDDSDEVRRDPQVADDPRVDPCQGSVADELDDAGARRNRVRDGDRRGDVAAGERFDRGSVAPADLVGGAARRPHVYPQRRGAADRCLECDQVVVSRDDLGYDAGALDVEALRRGGVRAAVGALRQVQAISGDVGPVTDDEEADGERADRQDQREATAESGQQMRVHRLGHGQAACPPSGSAVRALPLHLEARHTSTISGSGGRRGSIRGRDGAATVGRAARRRTMADARRRACRNRARVSASARTAGTPRRARPSGCRPSRRSSARPPGRNARR